MTNSMNVTNTENTNDESSHHSLILRYWRDSVGELRGQLINPITNSTFVFASASDMHKALDRAIDEVPSIKDGETKGSETNQT